MKQLTTTLVISFIMFACGSARLALAEQVSAVGASRAHQIVSGQTAAPSLSDEAIVESQPKPAKKKSLMPGKCPM